MREGEIVVLGRIAAAATFTQQAIPAATTAPSHLLPLDQSFTDGTDGARLLCWLSLCSPGGSGALNS